MALANIQNIPVFSEGLNGKIDLMNSLDLISSIINANCIDSNVYNYGYLLKYINNANGTKITNKPTSCKTSLKLYYDNFKDGIEGKYNIYNAYVFLEQLIPILIDKTIEPWKGIPGYNNTIYSGCNLYSHRNFFRGTYTSRMHNGSTKVWGPINTAILRKRICVDPNSNYQKDKDSDGKNSGSTIIEKLY